MKNSRKRITVIIVSIVAVLAIVSGSLAWYTSSTSLSKSAALRGFKTSAIVYFQNESGKRASAQADVNGLYIMSLNPQDINYVGNLKIRVVHTGYAKSYVRVKLNVQWTAKDGSIAENTVLPYKFDTKWYDNRNEDYCVYYTEDSGLFDSYDKSIITGFDAKKFEAEALTQSAVPAISITAESVQINRYQQLWKIDNLPWEK